MSSPRLLDLERIEAGLGAARRVLERFSREDIEVRLKSGDDPVTAADLAVDRALREALPREGEAWLSEETADDHGRLGARRVWIVDPIDGTREFVQGIPEWCVSIGLVEDGVPVAGGTLNPATNTMILGAAGHGVTVNGVPACPDPRSSLDGAAVLASRSEIKRGEWSRFELAGVRIVPCGSVAYKLSQVAAGLAPCTWTLVPKSEWDVAAGAALVLAAGGEVRTLDGAVPRFNQPTPKYRGLVACGNALYPAIESLLGLPARH